VSEILGHATGAVLTLLVAVLVIVLVGRWLGRNPDPARALLARAGDLPVLRWIRRRYGVLFFLLSMRLGPGWALVINLAAGLGLLFVGGLALAWVVRTVVEYSGLSAVDAAIGRLMADQRASDVDSAARAVVSILNGPVLIGVVAVVAIVLGWRARAWRGDLVGILGTVGAFLPLVVLALAADRLWPDPVGGDIGRGFLPTQATVVTASLCTLAWLVARQVRWLWAVTAWTSAAVGIVVVVGSRMYLGWTYASEAVTSVLLGALWTAMFMVASATRDRVAAGETAQADGSGPRPAGSATAR
jgi:undecaprenyl-diphosphatase